MEREFMHLHTIVRIKAETANEAIDRVNDLLTGNGSFEIAPFDYVSEDESKISEECKTEEDFKKLQDEEKMQAKKYIEQSKDKSITANERGYCLQLAGECLQQDKFFSTERLAYDYDFVETNGDEKGKIFFIDTDRHF